MNLHANADQAAAGANGHRRTPERILCYVRPWSLDQFSIIANAAFPSAKITLASDFSGIGEVPLSERFRALLRGPAIDPAKLLGQSTADDIRARCRLLRSLPRDRAHRMLGAMATALREVMDRHNPEVIVSFVVDSYVLDLMRHMIEAQGGEYIGLVTVFINGYFRVSGRGEGRRMQTPSDAEVDGVLAQLLNASYRPSYMVGSVHELTSGTMLVRRGIERWAGNLMRWSYFALRSLTTADYGNFHYESTRAVARSWVQWTPPYRWSRDWKARLASSDRRIFVPLQWAPEASIDYWCESLDVLDYEKQIEALVDAIGGGGQIVLKEHPAFWGYRRQSFYDRLLTRPNVVMPPPDVPAQALVAASDCVVSHSSSVAFEAALRGTPAILLSNAYYMSGRFMRFANDAAAVARLIADWKIAEPITPDEQRAMVRAVLTGCLPGRLRDDGSFDVKQPSHLEEATAIGESLRALGDRRAKS